MLSLFPWLALVPAGIYFYFGIRSRFSLDKRRIVESKYEPLREKLRTAVDSYKEDGPVVEELQEEEANLQKGVAERWTPYIASRVNVGPYVAAFGDLMQGIPGHISTPTTREPLAVDHEFMNHVLDRFKWQQIALRDIEPVHAAVEEILTLLENELNN